MKSSSWNWVSPRPAGLSKYGPRWLRPMAVAIPWITVLLLMMMLHFISGTLTAVKGVAFDLPEGDQLEGSTSPLVALVVPSDRDTLVFFDDARYSLGDRDSMAAFGEHVASRTARLEDKTFVVMADGRITGGCLSRLAAVLRANGVGRLLFAHQETEAARE